jgi:hypothetical protein
MRALALHAASSDDAILDGLLDSFADVFAELKGLPQPWGRAHRIVLK